MNIHIEGNIGAGKTTFLEFISKHFDCYISKEPVEEWMSLMDGNKNILDKFYEDINRWSFAFQMNCFISRIHQTNKVPKTGVNFIERSIHSDKIFASQCYEMGNMNPIEITIYNNWSSWLEFELGNKIDAIIYLRSTPEVSARRIKERARGAESSIDIEYLENLHKRHDYWLQNTDIKVYTIDADNLDYSDPGLFHVIKNIIKETAASN